MSAASTPKGAKLIWQRENDPAAWRKAIREALVKAGTIPGAAERLGIHRRNLEKWLSKEPSLREGIELRLRGRPLDGQ